MNFSTVVKMLDGSPVQNGTKTLTVGECCTTALLAQFQDETNLAGPEKVERFKLANKIYDAEHSLSGKGELTPEEIVKVKALVAKAYSTLIMCRVYEELDPKSVGRPHLEAVSDERKSHVQ